jgi:diguanylate cyclase (GGDEF)-like protein
VICGILFAAGETAVIAAVVAVGASLLSVGLTVLINRRLRRSGPKEERATELVRELDLRMRRLGEDLSEELERTREESRRARYLGELAWTIELDDVLRRTLDAAVPLDGVDAAMITVRDAADETVTKAKGLTPEEEEQLAIEHPKGGRVQSMTISYVRDPDAPDGGPPVATSVAVPIEARDRTIGIVSVFSRDELGSFPEETLQALEDLAARAGPAVDNALRYQEARRLAELDARTGLHNERFFDQALAREVAGAQRYGRRLALLLFDVDDFKQINDRLGHEAGNIALRGLAERLSVVLRSDDIACRLGSAADEFGVILHEATLEDAQRLYLRLRERLEKEPIAGVPPISLSAGIAEYDGREEADDLFLRADEAAGRAKRAGKGRVEFAPPSVRLLTRREPGQNQGQE